MRSSPSFTDKEHTTQVVYTSIRALMSASQDARKTKDVEAREEEITRLKDAIGFWSGRLENGNAEIELLITIAKRGAMLLENELFAVIKR